MRGFRIIAQSRAYSNSRQNQMFKSDLDPQTLNCVKKGTFQDESAHQLVFLSNPWNICEQWKVPLY